MFGFVAGCVAPLQYDVVLRNGTIYDGSGTSPYVGDLAINGDTIAVIGSLGRAAGQIEIDATGLEGALSPLLDFDDTIALHAVHSR